MSMECSIRSGMTARAGAIKQFYCCKRMVWAFENSTDQIPVSLMMRMPAFDDAAGSIFDGVGKNKGIRIAFIHQVFKFA